jgi:methionine synthase II (cobalamin-independent)
LKDRRRVEHTPEIIEIGSIYRETPMGPPFRAEHVGSLLRPDTLLQARKDHAEKRVSSEAFATTRDSAIVDIVKTQVDLGFHGVTDGEYGRDIFVGSFFVALEGFEKVEPDLNNLRHYGRFRSNC